MIGPSGHRFDWRLGNFISKIGEASGRRQHLQCSLGTIPKIDHRTLSSHYFRDFPHQRHSRTEERGLLENRDAVDSCRPAGSFLLLLHTQLPTNKIQIIHTEHWLEIYN